MSKEREEVKEGCIECHKCSECDRELKDDKTIYIHGGKLFCSRCYNAESGS